MGLLDSVVVAFRVVLTKADKLAPAELEERTRKAEVGIVGRPAAMPAVLATSVLKGTGLEGLQDEPARVALVRGGLVHIGIPYVHLH